MKSSDLSASLRVAIVCVILLFSSILQCLAASTDTLVSYWQFENDASDSSVVGSVDDSGSWVGTTSYAAGVHGSGIVLNGSNYISVPASVDVNRTGNDMSLSTWFRVDTWDTGWQCLASKGEGSAWRVARSGGDATQLSFAGGSGDISGGSVNDGQWHHVVAISEAGVSTRLIIDGVLVQTGGGPGIADSNLPMSIGQNSAAAGRQWKGGIDDMGMFSSPLNTLQAAAIYNLSIDTEYVYDLGEVNQLLATHACGDGSSVTVADTNWEYLASDPDDGRKFVALGSNGSGMAGSTGPAVRSFVADHPLLPAGYPLILSWDVGTDADTLIIDQGIGNVLPMTTAGIGSITLDPGPLGDVTYTITATNIDGTNTRSVSVEVTTDPVIEFFTASDTIVPPDTEITLSWSAINLTSLTLDGADVTGTSSIALTPISTTTYTLVATNAQGSTSVQVQVSVIIPGEPIISELNAVNIGPLLDEDDASSDWIEIYNPSASTAILNNYYLSDDPNNLTKWRLPDMNLGEQEYLIVFASGKDRAVVGSELHTNFSLRAGGEYLALSKVNGGATTILSEFSDYPQQFENFSYGYEADAVTLGYFTNPTPGQANGNSLVDYVRDTKYSVDRGFYDAPFSVEITTTTPDAQIRYTTNGNDPTPGSGTLYNGPVNISTTTVLKAIAYKTGLIQTNVDAQTYVFLDDVLEQPNQPPGFPGGTDFGMDPDVVNNPAYSSTIKDDLKAIPSISISMPITSMFGGSGIYNNSNQSGIAWERRGSVEMIYPSGEPGMQINCGVRMQGGVGRNGNFPKHSFRFLFKREYGATKLNFPLFKDATGDAEGAVDSFDSITLRSGFNNTWHRDSDGEEQRAQYLRDQFLHDSQLAMGDASCHGTFVHLYVNGLYWGLYNVVERPNADFGSSYYGGKKEEWDALNSYPRNVVDGTADDWISAHSAANAGVADQAGYDALSEYVDIPNLINYMLVNFYAGNLDWDDHNWYSINRRTPEGDGYKFVCWDAERTLESVNSNRTNINQANKPSRLYAQLRQNAEFRLQFADQAHQHLFNGGSLTPARTIQRYQALADYIDRAIVGESARWGDSKHATPYTRDGAWVAERDRILNSYLPARTNVVLSQLRGADLYPDTDAPIFSQHGGHVASTTELAMSSGSGTIHYTTDGSDPRLASGGINPNAVTYDGAVSSTTMVAAGSVWKYLADGSDQGTAWRAAAFDDASWAAGPAELGYGDGGEDTEVESGPDNDKFRTTYFRHTFNAADVDQFTTLALELQRDDGAIVYLNGNEVMRSNMPGGAVGYQTEAAGTASGGDETTFFSQAVDIAELNEGSNTFAVEVHQTSGTSSDISFDLRLRGTKPNNVNPLLMTETGMLRARALDGTDWSALNEAFFVVDAGFADDSNLVVSEVHYRPLAPDPVEEAAGFDQASHFEFIELENIGASDVDLTKVQFTTGITFDFSESDLGITLPAAGRILLVNNRDAFMMRYPSVPAAQIAGEFSGSLNNDGEQIVLLAGDGSVLRDFTYNDQSPWPESSDGDGFSLVLNAPTSNPDHADPFSWRPSVARGGTPGASDATAFAGADPDADLDGDGASAWIEHALGTSDSDPTDDAFPTPGVENIDALGMFQSITFTRNLAADDVIYTVELSTDLDQWVDGTGQAEFVSSTNNGDGTTTEVYRSAVELDSAIRGYMRLRVTQR
ncbi:MAG: hypothetical protein ACI9MB_003180 [Verrucomicrobiales bacterium]|jgi:hypothetical protein